MDKFNMCVHTPIYIHTYNYVYIHRDVWRLVVVYALLGHCPTCLFTQLWLARALY